MNRCGEERGCVAGKKGTSWKALAQGANAATVALSAGPHIQKENANRRHSSGTPRLIPGGHVDHGKEATDRVTPLVKDQRCCPGSRALFPVKGPACWELKHAQCLQVRSLGQEDRPVEERMATHSGILA